MRLRRGWGSTPVPAACAPTCCARSRLPSIVREIVSVSSRALEQDLLRARRELLPRHVARNPEVLADLLDDLAAQVMAERERGRRSSARSRPRRSSCSGSRDDEPRVDRLRDAEPVALGARAVRAVERERARLHLREAHAAVGAREARRERRRASRHRGPTSIPSPSFSPCWTASRDAGALARGRSRCGRARPRSCGARSGRARSARRGGARRRRSGRAT